MKKHIFLRILIAISSLCVIPLSVRGEDFTQGIAKLSGHLADGRVIRIETRTIKLTPQYPYKHAFMWGGDFEAVGDKRVEVKVVLPRTVIVTMNVQVGDERIFVPLSAYGDLGDPNKISLERAERGFRLVIRGGDAGGSYDATLTFNNENIERRRVCHGEFPDQTWQETVYSFTGENDGR